MIRSACAVRVMSAEATVQPIDPARLRAASLAALHARAFPADQAWGEHAISMMLALAGSFGALCPDRGLVLARVVAGEGEILTLAVVPEWRRQRLASALMAYALKEAGDRGAGAMLLEVADTNAAAIGLYRGLGFATVGRRRRYYPGGGDALVLRRGLD